MGGGRRAREPRFFFGTRWAGAPAETDPAEMADFRIEARDLAARIIAIRDEGAVLKERECRMIAEARSRLKRAAAEQAAGEFDQHPRLAGAIAKERRATREVAIAMLRVVRDVMEQRLAAMSLVQMRAERSDSC